MLSRLLEISCFLLASAALAREYANLYIRVTVWPTDKLQNIVLRFDRALDPEAVAKSFCAVLTFEADCQAMAGGAILAARGNAKSETYLPIGIDGHSQLSPLFLQMDDAVAGFAPVELPLSCRCRMDASPHGVSVTTRWKHMSGFTWNFGIPDLPSSTACKIELTQVAPSTSF